MSLSMGYRGPPMLASKFVDDPLAVVPGTTVRLYDWEVALALCYNDAGNWDELNPSQQREIARQILQYRNDEYSQLQLNWLGLNNPGMNQSIEIVSTGQNEAGQGEVPSGYQNPLIHCLL